MEIVIPSAAILGYTQNAVDLVERAGRVCYKSDTARKTHDEKCEFIRRLIGAGHHSVLEHASMTVRFVCDRGVSHEIVRHRIASYSQESTRYCNYSKDRFSNEIQVIEPPMTSPEQRQTWIAAMSACECAYMNLIAQGASPQIARSVLPNSLKTEVVMTANMREWRHFFDLRLHGTAGTPHPQMQEVARDLWNQVVKDRTLRVFFE